MVKRNYLAYSDFLRAGGRSRAGRRRRRRPSCAIDTRSIHRRDESGQLSSRPIRRRCSSPSKPAARASPTGCACSSRIWPRGASRRPTRAAFEVGRDLATTPGAVIYENDADAAHPVRTDDRACPRAAAPDRSAVHQQVLHPRPAAGEFVRALRRRARSHGVPGVVAQHHGRARSSDLGRLPRAGRHAGHRRRARGHAAPTRSTRWASASAARCSPRRWPSCRRRARTSSRA